MKLTQIITLANGAVEEQFRAMERSLRSVGCSLPLKVIPYDNNRFKLPPNASWWEIKELLDWLSDSGAHPAMRKYQCLLTEDYHFIDTDICFLSDPAAALDGASGFTVCCGHWRAPEHTCTPQSLAAFQRAATNWQRQVFNSGQFACDRPLYTLSELQNLLSSDPFRSACLLWPHNEQPGMNLLRLHSAAPLTNLTLEPPFLESSWAGDYPAEFEPYWQDPLRRPYLIHWAGLPLTNERPINSLLLQHLTPEEQDRLRGKDRRPPADSFLKRLVHRMRRCT